MKGVNAPRPSTSQTRNVTSAVRSFWKLVGIFHQSTPNNQLMFPQKKRSYPRFQCFELAAETKKNMQNQAQFSIPKANWPLAPETDAWESGFRILSFWVVFRGLFRGAKLVLFFRFRDPKTKAKRYQGVRFPTTWSLRIPSSLVDFLRLVRMGWVIWGNPPPKKKNARIFRS